MSEFQKKSFPRAGEGSYFDHGYLRYMKLKAGSGNVGFLVEKGMPRFKLFSNDPAEKDKGGITIKIIRPDFVENALTGEKFPIKVHRQEHESETALDNIEFDYEIQNDGTIAELIDKVEAILKQEQIIS